MGTTSPQLTSCSLRIKPYSVTHPLLRLGPIAFLLTHSPPFRVATLWVLAVVCSVAPPDHVYRGFPHHGTPGASIIFFKHLFAHKPLFRKKLPILTRYCQPNLVHLSLNPFQFQHIFHPLVHLSLNLFQFQHIFHPLHQHLLGHAFFGPGHLTVLRNALNSWSRLSHRFLCILFGLVQRLHSCPLPLIMACRSYP